MDQLHTASQAAQWLRARVRGQLVANSRTLQAGDGFVAWPGAATDGRAFVPAALQAGAAACLVEHDGVAQFDFKGPHIASMLGLKEATGAIAAEFFGHPSDALDLLAITGTNGKTSVAWWLAQALTGLPGQGARPCGLVGTLGIGSPATTLVPSGLTTPDPVLLQRALRDFVVAGMRACALEASSIGLEEGRLHGARVRVAVFTNFSQDHLDYHGSMEAYWQSKRRLFFWPGLHSAVINVDDARGVQLLQTLQARGQDTPDLWTVSTSADARLMAQNIRYAARGMEFDVVEAASVGHARSGGALRHRVHTGVIGAYNISNLLCVMASMRTLGVPLQDAVAACAHLQPVPGRMECLPTADGPLVAVDYAHTPDALDNALLALRPLAQARGGALWCVFGCGGNRDAAKRPLMGAIAAKQADHVVVTSDNPRNEKPEAIIAQILLGLPTPQSAHVQTDRALAIAQTIAHAAPRDVVLIAGKGHEDTQEIAGVKSPFSDQAHARAALHSRGRSAMPTQEAQA